MTDSVEHMMDSLAFTMQDLGVEYVEGMPDVELLELVERKLRMLHRIASIYMTPDVLRATMNG
jgi:hypothetical protein